MKIDLSEIQPPLRDQFAPFDRTLSAEGQTTFVWIDAGSNNPRKIGFLQSCKLPTEFPSVNDAERDEWIGDQIVEKGSGGAGVFWWCPGVPQFALIRLRYAESAGRASWGRRFRGAVRSEGDFRLFSTRHVPVEEEDASTDFKLTPGDFEVFLDEHFVWPCSDFLKVNNDQILFTVTFVSSAEIEEFPSPALVSKRSTEPSEACNP